MTQAGPLGRGVVGDTASDQAFVALGSSRVVAVSAHAGLDATAPELRADHGQSDLTNTLPSDRAARL